MTAWTAPPPRRAGPAAADAGDGAAMPTVDVGELARIAARRLRLLLPCLAIAGAIALAYVALTPSRYAATMSILVDPRERVPVGLDAQPMPQNPDVALVESEMSILTSRAVLRRVAEAQDLADDPEFRPGLIALFVGSLTSLWRAPAGDPDARLEAVVVALGDRISVKRSERNYIAEVEVRAASPAKAERLAQGLADAFFAEQAALSDQVVAKQSAWLDARIAELQPRAEEAERRAQAYRETNAIVLSDGRISPEQQLKDANDALVAARGKRGEVEAAYEQVKAALASSAAGGEGVVEALHSPVIEKLRADQAALARDEAYELSTLGPRHPSYLTTRAQLQSVQAQIDAEIKRIRSASERDLKAARAAEQEAAKLVASLEAANQQFGGTPHRARPPERRSRGVARRLREGAVDARERASRHRRIAAQRRGRSAGGEARQGQPADRTRLVPGAGRQRSIFGSSPSSPPNTATAAAGSPPRSRPRPRRLSRRRRLRPPWPPRRRPPQLRRARRRTRRRPPHPGRSRSTSPSPPSPRGPPKTTRATAARRSPPPKRR